MAARQLADSEAGAVVVTVVADQSPAGWRGARRRKTSAYDDSTTTTPAYQTCASYLTGLTEPSTRWSMNVPSSGTPPG
jgi:hypothetical protein